MLHFKYHDITSSLKDFLPPLPILVSNKTLLYKKFIPICGNSVLSDYSVTQSIGKCAYPDILVNYEQMTCQSSTC